MLEAITRISTPIGVDEMLKGSSFPRREGDIITDQVIIVD